MYLLFVHGLGGTEEVRGTQQKKTTFFIVYSAALHLFAEEGIMSDAESGEEFDDFMLEGIGSPPPVVGSSPGIAASSPVEAATGSATKTAERARLLEMGVDREVTPVVDEMKTMFDVAIKEFFYISNTSCSLNSVTT